MALPNQIMIYSVQNIEEQNPTLHKARCPYMIPITKTKSRRCKLNVISPLTENFCYRHAEYGPHHPINWGYITQVEADLLTLIRSNFEPQDIIRELERLAEKMRQDRLRTEPRDPNNEDDDDDEDDAPGTPPLIQEDEMIQEDVSQDVEGQSTAMYDMTLD